jgi:hypothetical protein
MERATRTPTTAELERPTLLTLPSDLRLQEYLDGGGIGGTQDLYSFACAHRALAYHASLATRLDVRVD